MMSAGVFLLMFIVIMAGVFFLYRMSKNQSLRPPPYKDQAAKDQTGLDSSSKKDSRSMNHHHQDGFKGP